VGGTVPRPQLRRHHRRGCLPPPLKWRRATPPSPPRLGRLPFPAATTLPTSRQMLVPMQACFCQMCLNNNLDQCARVQRSRSPTRAAVGQPKLPSLRLPPGSRLDLHHSLPPAVTLALPPQGRSRAALGWPRPIPLVSRRFR
jgi:hypothetical protein